MTLNEYFDRILCINLARRPDRWRHVEEQCRLHQLTVERFDGYDIKAEGGGNYGCNASHRGVLELIAHHRWPRTLVLEDDFEFVHPDMQERFAEYIQEVPDDWDWLYLGGSYADDPKCRISRHVIQTNGIMTTTAYAVKWPTARMVAPWIQGGAGIDTLYHGFTSNQKSYIFDPRLVVQYPNYSDIQCREMDNSQSMLDPHHVARLDARGK